jgi:hypothetical protein
LKGAYIWHFDLALEGKGSSPPAKTSLHLEIEGEKEIFPGFPIPRQCQGMHRIPLNKD